MVRNTDCKEEIAWKEWKIQDFWRESFIIGSETEKLEDCKKESLANFYPQNAAKCPCPWWGRKRRWKLLKTISF